MLGRTDKTFRASHVQLTLHNWENKSVWALNKKLKFPIDNIHLPMSCMSFLFHNLLDLM